VNTRRRFPPHWSVDDPDKKLGEDCLRRPRCRLAGAQGSGIEPRNRCAPLVVFLSHRRTAMATNNPRHGYERKRSRETGQFMDQKKTGKFKAVRREGTARGRT
jgi:hypothetical protein